MRIIIFWGLYWGPLILGNYHMSFWDAVLDDLLLRYWGSDFRI